MLQPHLMSVQCGKKVSFDAAASIIIKAASGIERALRRTLGIGTVKMSAISVAKLIGMKFSPLLLHNFFLLNVVVPKSR